MSALHDWELADTLETEQARRRSRNGPRPMTSAHPRYALDLDTTELDESNTATWHRIRLACCDDGPFTERETDEHAARIAVLVQDARRRAGRRAAAREARKQARPHALTGSATEPNAKGQ